MKMKIKEFESKIYRIEYGKNFIIEIYLMENDIVEYWIFNKLYGIKMLMYSINYKIYNKNELVEIVKGSIENYIKVYKEKYMD